MRARAQSDQRGVQRAQREGARDGRGGHPRTVSRPAGDVQARRIRAGHELPLPGRLRGPRVLLGRDGHARGGPQGSLPRPRHHHPRQPREPADHAGVRLLRRVHEEVRTRGDLESVHRPVRLHATHRGHREPDLLPARRAVAVHRLAGRRPQDRSVPGGAARRAGV